MLQIFRPFLFSSAALALGVLAWQPVAAQGIGPLSNDSIKSGAPKAPPRGPAPAPPPAAVPGAVPRADSVAPANPGVADMPPTEALFDSINRGDIITARDAIARGADLDGTNLLGLTPLELSVDLGRNDISFLLLSLRPPGGQRYVPPGQERAAALPTAAERHKAQQEAAAQARAARKQELAAARPAPVAAVRAPSLFAGNGGAPNPSAGFLGFDPQH